MWVTSDIAFIRRRGGPSWSSTGSRGSGEGVVDVAEVFSAPPVLSARFQPRIVPPTRPPTFNEFGAKIAMEPSAAVCSGDLSAPASGGQAHDGEGFDAGDAALRVGYESPSQFGRESRRLT